MSTSSVSNPKPAGEAKKVSPEDEKFLLSMQKTSFRYFTKEANPDNGLVADKTLKNWPASIAATGFGLTVYLTGVERGLIDRTTAAQRTLTLLRFLWNSPQGTQADATGYKGFFYHFLDMKSGQRAFRCELSTIDTAILLLGVLSAGQYFHQDNKEETEIRKLADQLYRRVEWGWVCNGKATLSHGWLPESGFLPYRWEGYEESLLMYILALGSPTHSLPVESYTASTADYTLKKIYGRELLYAGPLFIHQYPQVWIDFREIQDEFMRGHGLTYFENSRRATLIQQEYAQHNPLEYKDYDSKVWGLTACDGPGPTTFKINGVQRIFYNYIARGAPYGPDDGTLAPWAVAASLPFAPEIVLPSLRHFHHLNLHKNPYGYKASFNPTFPENDGNPYGWTSPYHFGINQGPIVLMIENYLSEQVWKLMQDCRPVKDGLRKARFSGGWLEG